MTLALKHALVERERRAPRAARRGAGAAGAATCPASRPIGPRRRRSTSRRPTAALDDALALIAGARRPVIVVGHGARFDMDGGRSSSPRRSTRRCSRRSRPRAWSPTTTRSARGVLGRSGTPVASWLMNESDLLVVFGASFSNHTGIAPYKPIVQVDFDPMALGRFHPVTVPVLGHVGVTAAPARASGSPAAADRGRPARRRRRALGDLAGREGAPPRSTTAGTGVRSAAVFAALDPPRARRRGDRRRRRQQHLLVRPLLRVHAPVGADVGLPRLDRLRLPGRDGRVGRRTRPPDRRRHRRRRLRPVPRRDHHRGEVRHEHHPRAARQPHARQDHQGAARRRVRRLADRRCTTRTSPRTPSCAARSASGSTAPTSSTTRSPRALAHDGPALVAIIADPDLV